MEESDYGGMLLNWVFFFALFGGAIYAGVRFAKLASKHNQNRFIFAAVGFVIFMASVRFGGNLISYLKIGPGYIPAATVILLAAAVVTALYVFLKRLWEKRAS